MTASGDRRSSGAGRSARRDHVGSEGVETSHHDLAAEQRARDGLAPYASYEGPTAWKVYTSSACAKGPIRSPWPPAWALAPAMSGTGSGFSAEMTDAVLDLVRRDPDAEFVEDNVMGTAI